MTEHQQYNLEDSNNQSSMAPYGLDGNDFVSSPNVLQTGKSIIVGKNRVINDSNKGLITNYVIRGIDTTGYSTVTVFDSTFNGLHQVRTHPDFGNTTIDMTSPGEKGQEIYLKIDNDVLANRTITFGTPFIAQGTATGSTNASIIMHFISDGTNFYEVSRSPATSAGFSSGCRVYNNGTQVVGNDTWTKVTLDTEDYDVGGEFDSTTNYRFTATSAGKYVCIGKIHTTASADGNDAFAALRVNNTEFSRKKHRQAGTNDAMGIIISDILNLTAGQYVELFCYFGTNGRTLSASGASGSGDACSLSIYRVA